MSRRHEDRHAPGLEGQHHAVSRPLRHVAVKRSHVHPTVAKRAVELLAADLRAHEHDHLLPRRLAAAFKLRAQHLHELGGLVLGVDVQLKLGDGVDRERRGLYLDCRRLVHVVVRQLADRRRHGGREERRLAAGGRQREDPLDVLQEAEVEHLVGLVEHHEAALVQHQRVAPNQIQDAAHRADDDVPARSQLRLLVADRRATEDGDHVDAGVRPIRAQRLRHLDAELARGRQHERLHGGLGRVDVLEDRQAKSSCLAGSGLRLADHIAALQERRDRLLLDRARRGVADVAQRLKRRGRKPEIGECCGHGESAAYG